MRSLQAIAIHTFVVVWWRKGIHAILISKIIVACIRLFVILFAVVNIGIHVQKNDLYVVPTPLSRASSFVDVAALKVRSTGVGSENTIWGRELLENICGCSRHC
jgi:hypothetical protein